MSQDPHWIDTALKAARPRAIDALLNYFGSVELAEEAFQEACLKALGCGLSIEPARVHVGLDGERVRLPAPGGEVEVVLASFAPQPGWVAAIALQPA